MSTEKTVYMPWFTAAVLILGMPVLGQEPESVVAPGKAVELEFTMSLEDGTIVTTNVGGAPMQYVHGDGLLFARLEEEIAGMHVDETKSVTLEAEEAYGPNDPTAIREVPKEDVPEEAQTVGTQLAVQGVDWPVLVSAVTPESVVLDMNHPLAGQTLRFDIRVLSIT
jgi:FKBP-type peptidyl-prolyl cis-trans isomerase SlyD